MRQATFSCDVLLLHEKVMINGLEGKTIHFFLRTPTEYPNTVALEFVKIKKILNTSV